MKLVHWPLVKGMLPCGLGSHLPTAPSAEHHYIHFMLVPNGPLWRLTCHLKGKLESRCCCCC